MPYRTLGLFDTPPNRQEIRLGLTIAGLLLISLVVLMPLHAIEVGEVTAFVPTIDVAMCVCELIIGALLYAQAVVFRSRALTILGSGYVLAALLLVPHALTTPGVFTANGLLDASASTGPWIYNFRRLLFPITIILYALLKRADSTSQRDAERSSAPIFRSIVAAVALAGVWTALATIGHDLLPQLFFNSREAISSRIMVMCSAGMGLSVTAIILLMRQKVSVLDLWLLVAAFAWLVQSILNFPIHSRSTIGCYSLYGMMLVSNLVIMFALIAESGRLYARLAEAMASSNRELSSRLLAVDAVSAVIAHEVGQPLTAVSLSAMAGIDSLSRVPPEPEKAIESLRTTMEAVRRTFDVIKSIRPGGKSGPGGLSEFCLNKLVRETTSLLDRDMMAQKIALQMTLDETLHPIQGDRVQIQRVIVNLLTNSIDALATAPRRGRRIDINTGHTDGGNIVLAVRDTGASIAPDKLTQIFDPFFTTKSNGTGLGLSLSRTIVEDHGGRLWASANEDRGATFHVQLPCRCTLRA